MSRRTITIGMTTLALAGAASLGIANPADASPIRECGNDTHGYWSYRSPLGAGNVNLTTRNVGCWKARRLVNYGFGRSWSCRTTRLGVEYYDVRCTRGYQVVHWQGGA